ncbi:MAG: hypothetical protein H6706_09275 [Myxococcales bacterium]|nr:hypothetical protein [Myxococcales bacterium]
MPQSLDVLLFAAVSVAGLHTLIGIDHTLPFVALGRARGWSLRRILAVTALCGLGHVLSSVVLGVVGIGLGTALEQLSWIESSRGELAAWLLIAFGLAYAGGALLRRAGRQPGRHELHSHGDALVHAHPHAPGHGHARSAASVTVWSLFIIFVLGPCEPLIPLLMAPAVEHGAGAVVLVASVFGAVTIGTMLVVVTLLHHGLKLAALQGLERHAHVLAGLAIAASGVAIQSLGI